MSVILNEIDTPVLTGQQASIVRTILDEAIEAAQAHDGSEDSHERVLNTAVAFERCAEEIAGNTAVPSLEHEASISAAIVGDEINTLDLLDIAIRNFGQRLQDGLARIVTIETGFVFLPPDDLNLVIPGSGEGVRNPLFAPRVNHLIALLNQHGIYTDDLVRYTGIVTSTMMRQKPYNLIQIPRLNREVLVCDQVGEACFVGIGLRGPAFWAVYHKSELRMTNGVTRIVHNAYHETHLLNILFHDNPPGKKVKVHKSQAKNFSITADFILIKALEYTTTHDGKLPTQHSGKIAGIAEQTWGAFNNIIGNQLRGFDLDGISGLGDLYNQFGLKNGKNENPKVVARAIENLGTTGQHGLTRQTVVKITADFILIKALEYAATHDGKLPTQHNGEVAGIPGQTWKGLSLVIHQKLRGFDLDGISGIGDLYNQFGLKNGQNENPKVIARAIENLGTTGQHGLTRQTVVKITADFILIKALEYAATHDGKLPTQKSGEVTGTPGQTWGVFHNIMGRKLRGFDLADVKGYGDLYNQFGLKNGRNENQEVIARAINSFKTTGHHGLTRQTVVKITADFILIKALEYAIAHEGKLPVVTSGNVIIMPGQTWSNFDSIINRKSRGFDLDGVIGLNDLYNQVGLKNGKKENQDVIARCMANIKAGQPHGLIYKGASLEPSNNNGRDSEPDNNDRPDEKTEIRQSKFSP